MAAAHCTGDGPISIGGGCTGKGDAGNLDAGQRCDAETTELAGPKDTRDCTKDGQGDDALHKIHKRTALTAVGSCAMNS